MEFVGIPKFNPNKFKKKTATQKKTAPKKKK